MTNRITILDIARRAGVGRSTVSRALRNDPRCNKETRERIQALAVEMSYVPDPALSALVAHRDKSRPVSATYNIALVDNVSGWGDAYRSAIRQGIENEAARLGYALEYLAPDSFESPRKLASVAAARGVRGLVWAWLMNERFIPEFPWERFAHVGFLLPVVRPNIHRVRDDAFRTVFDAARAAFQAGFERPALAILTSPGSVNDRFQSAGWLQAHAEATRTPLPVWYGGVKGVDDLHTWVKSCQPDLIIGNTDGIYWKLRTERPDVFDRCCYLNLLHGGEHFPGFDCSEEDIARALVSQLDGQLRRNELGLTEAPRTTLVKRKFLEQERLREMKAGARR